jgi:hypothetical protein
MYVTPVRQKWANQVAELAGKKEVKAGLLHIDFVPSEYNHKVHFTEVNKKKGVSLSWPKDPYGTLEPQLATTLTITASIYILLDVPKVGSGAAACWVDFRYVSTGVAG